ncbi:hypothetical protein Dimus_023131 [Dionaea muscipula]
MTCDLTSRDTCTGSRKRDVDGVTTSARGYRRRREDATLRRLRRVRRGYQRSKRVLAYGPCGSHVHRHYGNHVRERYGTFGDHVRRRKDTSVSATLMPAATCRPLRMIDAEMGRINYIGTLANVDAKFFSDFVREDFQLEEIIYIENLWKNWDPDSEPDPSLLSKILEELTNYVWGLNPEWGIEWWNVLAVCLVARSHWVLAHVNLEEWAIEIYDSLAPENTKKSRPSFGEFREHEDTSSTILDEVCIFQRSDEKKKNRSF